MPPHTARCYYLKRVARKPKWDHWLVPEGLLTGLQLIWLSSWSLQAEDRPFLNVTMLVILRFPENVQRGVRPESFQVISLIGWHFNVNCMKSTISVWTLHSRCSFAVILPLSWWGTSARLKVGSSFPFPCPCNFPRLSYFQRTNHPHLIIRKVK